jgi:acetyltransferase-like isoleucine patch superfamily enzyme
MKASDKLMRLIDIVAALVRGQVFLFPRLNTRLLRIHGKVKVRGPRGNVRIGRRVTFLGDADLVCGWDAPDGKIDIGDEVVLETGCYLNAHGGRITIGTHAFIGVRAVIQGKGNVSIGPDAMLGPHVQVHSSDHGTRIGETPFRAQPDVATPVTIGRNVWIGANSVLLRGTDLAPGTIVGANSIVRLRTEGPSLVARPGGMAQCVRTYSQEGSKE